MLLYSYFVKKVTFLEKGLLIPYHVPSIIPIRTWEGGSLSSFLRVRQLKTTATGGLAQGHMAGIGVGLETGALGSGSPTWVKYSLSVTTASPPDFLVITS